MEGNKLKHNFVEKRSIFRDILDRLNSQDRFIPPRDLSVREWETITVSEEISNNVLRWNDENNYLDMVKKEMSRKLADILLENNFIEMIEEERPYYDTKRIIMKLNVEKR
jgi:hypothetical protein